MRSKLFVQDSIFDSFGGDSDAILDRCTTIAEFNPPQNIHMLAFSCSSRDYAK